MAYNQPETSVRTFIRTFMVLPLLKITDIANQIQETIDESADIITQYPALNEFTAYFQNFWMNGDLARWNIYNVTDYRTNNDLEGWHFKILTEITQHGNRSALPFWKFVKTIGHEALNQQLTVEI